MVDADAMLSAGATEAVWEIVLMRSFESSSSRCGFAFDSLRESLFSRTQRVTDVMKPMIIDHIMKRVVD